MQTDNGLLGKSAAIAEIRHFVGAVAATDYPVLVLGERGTGKNLCAFEIHAASHWRGKPLVSVDCGSLPASLIESVLFGHERGAFTGAVHRATGRLEEANGTTLFLDEIALLSLEGQGCLLRFLEDNKVRRVGGQADLLVRCRIVAATNRDLRVAVGSGQFLPDLYDRLNVLRITMPPLRQRREDVPLLADHFVSLFPEKRKPILSREAMSALKQHPFPGNVRELRNICCRLEAFFPGERVGTAEIKKVLA
jgi:DNA-binding NtrC family response regulator